MRAIVVLGVAAAAAAFCVCAGVGAGCGGGGAERSPYRGEYTGWYGLSVATPIELARIERDGRLLVISGQVKKVGRVKDGRLWLDWIQGTPITFDGRTIRGAEIELIKR